MIRTAPERATPAELAIATEPGNSWGQRTIGVFDELMPTTLATAGVGRLLHHAHVILTQGDSYRLKEATTGKGIDAPHATAAGEN